MRILKAYFFVSTLLFVMTQMLCAMESPESFSAKKAKSGSFLLTPRNKLNMNRKSSIEGENDMPGETKAAGKKTSFVTPIVRRFKKIMDPDACDGIDVSEDELSQTTNCLKKFKEETDRKIIERRQAKKENLLKTDLPPESIVQKELEDPCLTQGQPTSPRTPRERVRKKTPINCSVSERDLQEKKPVPQKAPRAAQKSRFFTIQ